ncbi:probable cytochrome P450 49a1 [Saccostrea echinata]|uniref:probable cytochrome P450 49a1 n=1 Tax=Saccostrea echinata TaxID=191078 RepID=UPI002A7EC44D|nr:probable cytochrome P450 49a1 [Saccostrea echinata]
MFTWHNMAKVRSGLFRALRHRHYSVQSTASISPESINVKPFHEIPGPKGKYTIPWIGTVLMTRSMGLYPKFKFADFATKLQETFGDLVKTRLKDKWTVFVFHPDIAKEVMDIRMPHPYRPPIDILAAYSSRKNHCQSLATRNGEEWAALRKPTQELITKPAVVADYVHILSDVAEDFVGKYKNGGKVADLRSTLVNYATESVGMLCFNRRLGCLCDVPIIDINLLEDMFEAIFIDYNYQGVKLYKYFETPFYKKFERAADHLYGICHAEIRIAMEKLEAAKREGKIEEYVDGPNLLYSMLTHPSMTLEYTERSLMDLFVAGVESTANTLTFLWFELAKNPEKQERLYEEIISVCGDSDVTKEALTRMSYLKACVREIMRLYRPTNLHFRYLKNEAVIGGYRIPPGEAVYFQPLFAHVL